MNKRDQSGDQINERSSLKNYIIQTPLSVPKLSEIINGVVEYLDTTSESFVTQQQPASRSESSLGKLNKLLELTSDRQRVHKCNPGVNLQQKEERLQQIIL